MANRTRDEVIYTRVDHTLMREFEKQKSESGYKSNADFIDYLLRVNRGKQIDGVTLKEFTKVMNDVSYELKKQGVNINQMARNINAYPDLASKTSFDFYQRKGFEYTRTEQDIEHSSQSVKDYSKWEDDETDKEKDYRKESEQSSRTQEEPEVMQVTPYQAYDEFQEKHEIPENDDTIFYGAAFDDFNKEWQGVGTSNSDTSGMSGNHADALEETLDIPVPSEYRKLSLTERAKLLPPPSDDRMEELNKYMERMGYTEESMQGIRYKMSVFDEFNDEYDARVKYARERRSEEYEKEQEKQQIVTLTHRNGR